MKTKKEIINMLLKESKLICKAGALSCAFREHAMDVAFNWEAWIELCVDIAEEVQAAKRRRSLLGRMQARFLKMRRGKNTDESASELKGLIRYAVPYIPKEITK